MYRFDNILYRHNNSHVSSSEVKIKNKSITKFEPNFLKDFVQIKSPFCQRHSFLKQRCECSYHKIKRSRQICLQVRSHTISAVKNSLQEYKSKISNSIKGFGQNQIFLNKLLHKNVERRFRKTQNLVPKKLQKIVFRKQRQSLGVHNRPFEKILRLRIQNMKDNDKAIYLMRFMKMEIRKDSRHLLNVREYIFANFFRIVQKFGFGNIGKIDKNKLEMEQISKMMGCKYEIGYQVIKQLQNEIKRFQQFLQNKFSIENQNKQVHGDQNEISLNTKVLDEIFVTEEELLEIGNNSLEVQKKQIDFLEKQSENKLKRFASNVGLTRRLSLLNVRKKSILNDGMGSVENEIKEIQAWSQKDSNISSIGSDEKGSEDESEIKTKKIKQINQNDIKICDSNGPQNVSGKGTDLHKKTQSLDHSSKQQHKSKQSRRFQSKENLKKKKKKKINLKSIGVKLSDFEMAKINSIIDSPNVIPLQQKVRKLFNTIKNRVQDNDSFSLDFLLKICALLSLEEAKTLEQKFTSYQFDKMILQLKRQADHCIQQLKNEREKIVEVPFDENDDEMRIRKISQSRKNSLIIDWFLTKTNLKNEFNNLKVSESRSKHRENKSRDSNLRQAEMGEINLEEKDPLSLSEQQNQSEIMIAQEDGKQNEKQKVKGHSVSLNLNEHLRILRYMKDRRPNAFMQVTQNVRNTLEMAYCSNK